MNWFRLYVDARNDAKLRTLTDAEHRVWFNLLCYSAEQQPRGSVTGVTSVTDVTDDLLLAIEVAGGDLPLLTGTVEKLLRLRILTFDDDGMTFVNFKKRQYDKPSDMPEETRRRKQAQRERERAESGVTEPEEGVTGVTPRDVTTRTEQSRNRTEQNTSPPNPPEGDAPDGADDGKEGEDDAAANKGKRGTRFSPDAVLTDEWRDAAIKLGYPAEHVEWLFDEFKDYWCAVPGQKGTKLDWLMTWRNRVRDTVASGRKIRHIPQAPREEVPGYESWRERKLVL